VSVDAPGSLPEAPGGSRRWYGGGGSWTRRASRPSLRGLRSGTATWWPGGMRPRSH